MDIARWERLKGEVDKLQRDVDRAEGSLHTLLDRLRKEHGCESLEDARELLNRLSRKEAKLEERFDQSLEAFEQKWDGVLQRDNTQ